MDFQQAALTICAAAVAYVWYKRHWACTISDIPGPKNPSWIFGHQWWWQLKEALVFEEELLDEYGTIVRWNGALGEQRLWIADPKAIHHILQGSIHAYGRPRVVRELLATIIDKGLSWSDGDMHKRHRRAMTPSFGLVEAKALYPYFVHCSNTLADKWHDVISNSESGKAAIIDAHSWFSKAALDAIGTGAFDYDFGAMENSDNKLTKSYENLTFGAFGMPSKGHFFVLDALQWTPPGFPTWLLNRSKDSGLKGLRENKKYVYEVAAKLIENKRQEMRDGASRKDLLSLLVKANSSLRPDWRLNDDEILAQVRTIMFAGHETSAKTLTYALWELARKRHVQEKLRAEIMETLGRVRARGDTDFAVSDFDSMPYLLAFGKEILRVYPAVTEILRAAKDDNVLPLSKPVVGVSGKVYNEIPIPAGTFMHISTLAYNLNKDLWGPDAYEFRPERWLDMSEKRELPFGVYGNLASFSGGPRNCIGWRFAVIEIHTFLVTVVRKFDFSLADNGQKIWNFRSGLITPLVIGEEHKGPQMPLKVTALRND